MFWRLEQPTDLLIWLINLISICVLIDVVLSWVSMFGGRVPWYNPVIRFIRKIADAVLSPIRGVLSRILRGAGMGGMGIDLSPLIALVMLSLLRNTLINLFG